MKTYSLVTTQDVTQEQIEDVMTTAFEGGSNYWIDEVTVDIEPTEKYKYMSEVLTRGGTLKVYVEGEDVIQTLTLGRFLNALSNEHFDFDNYDAGGADAVLQKAIFGEVIYG